MTKRDSDYARFKAWAHEQLYGPNAMKRRPPETPTQLWNRYDAELADVREAEKAKRRGSV